MQTPNKIAFIAGSALLVTGLSFFTNPHIGAAMDGLMANQGLLWVTALLTFIMGAVVLSLYNTWSKSWLVAVTIVGWLSLIKGAVLMLFPQAMALFYTTAVSYVSVAWFGVYAIVFGLFMLWIGFTKK